MGPGTGQGFGVHPETVDGGHPAFEAAARVRRRDLKARGGAEDDLVADADRGAGDLDRSGGRRLVEPVGTDDDPGRPGGVAVQPGAAAGGNPPVIVAGRQARGAPGGTRDAGGALRQLAAFGVAADLDDVGLRLGHGLPRRAGASRKGVWLLEPGP